MTIRAVLTAMRRRWYVVVVALIAAVLAFAGFSNDGGIYTTKTVVSFLVPATTSLSADNGSGDSSVISFARSVAAQVNSGRHPVSYSMDDSPYYGAGLRQGVLVVVPNDGNQWYESFSHAEIDIQIVGRTEQWVKQQQSLFVDQILAVAKAQQDGLVANPGDYLTASVLPLTQDITEVGPSKNSQLIALVALLLAGFLVGSWGAVVLERRLSRPRSPSSPAISRPSVFSLKDSTT